MPSWIGWRRVLDRDTPPLRRSLRRTGRERRRSRHKAGSSKMKAGARHACVTGAGLREKIRWNFGIGLIAMLDAVIIHDVPQAVGVGATIAGEEHLVIRRRGAPARQAASECVDRRIAVVEHTGAARAAGGRDSSCRRCREPGYPRHRRSRYNPRPCAPGWWWRPRSKSSR